MDEGLTAADERPAERRSLWWSGAKLAGIAVVVAVLGVLVWATLAAGRGSSLVAQVAAGKKPAAPGFDLGVLWAHVETWPTSLAPAAADAKVGPRELRGYPVVVNFWASWCIPCRQEAPVLRASALRHRGRVAFVGIDVKDLRGDALAFLRKYRLNYVSLRDGSGDRTWISYGLTGVPESYFLDGRGRIVTHVPGAVSAETLEQGVASITRPSSGGSLQGGTHVTP